MPPRVDLTAPWVIVKVGEQCYAISTKHAREMIPCPEITRVPHTDPSVRGVINLRGQVMPLLDLRRKLGLPRPPEDLREIAVVLGDDRAKAAAVVDSVVAVEQLDPSQVAGIGDLDAQVDAQGEAGLISGVGRWGADRDIVLLIDAEWLIAHANHPGPAA